MSHNRSNHVRVVWNGQPLDCEYDYAPEERGDYCSHECTIFGVIEALLPDGTDIIDTLTISETMKLNRLAEQQLLSRIDP